MRIPARLRRQCSVTTLLTARVLTLLGLTFATFSSASAQTVLTWTPVDLGTLGGRPTDSSEALAINNRGDIVGDSTTPNNERHAFLWTEAGGLRGLGTLGGPTSRARAINESRQVVGTSSNALGHQHAFLWSEPGGMIDLGTLGGTTSEAVAINNLGQVIGTSTNASGERRPFMWTATTGMVDLTPQLGADAVPADINDDGHIVAAAASVGSFLWTAADGRVRIVDAVNPRMAAYDVRAVNQRGQVTGTGPRFADDPYPTPYVWSATTRRLETVGFASYGVDVNDFGEVLARAAQPPSGDSVFVPGGSTFFVTLRGAPDVPFGRQFTQAPAISVAGAVGVASWPTGLPDDYRAHATLWRRPQTESATLSTFQASPQVVGTGITLLASHSGGVPPYEFRFWIQPLGSAERQLLRDWGTHPGAEWVPATAGGYNLMVESRSAGATSVAAQATALFTVVPRVTLSTTLEEPQPAGTSITVTAAGSGGTEPYTYRFWIWPVGASEWQVARDWSTAASFAWMPTTAGRYSLAVEARTAGGTEFVRQAFRTYLISPGGGGGGGGVMTGVTLATSLASPQPAGTTVTFSAVGSGGTMPYAYRFWVQPWATGVWTVVQDWSAAATFAWTPTAAGGYNVSVEARSAGATAVEVQAATAFTIGAGSGGGGGGGGGGGAMTSVTLATSLASPQPAGTTITLTATGSGGTTPYGYRFWLQPWSTGVWTVVRDWSATPTFAWTPTTAGGYNLSVEGRSAGGTAVEVQSATAYTVGEGSGGGGGGGGGGGAMTSVALATNLASPQPAGTTITLTATGSGGTTPHAVRFWLQPWATGVWTVVRDWSATATFAWTPTTAGGYNLSVEARSAGATAVEVQTATAFTIGTATGGGGGGGGGVMTGVTLTANAFWPQPLGTSVTWMATGSGGTAPYQYRFWVQPWNGTWTVVRDWSPTPTFAWQPTTAGGYNVSVEARSAGGATVEVQTAEIFMIAAP